MSMFEFDLDNYLEGNGVMDDMLDLDITLKRKKVKKKMSDMFENDDFNLDAFLADIDAKKEKEKDAEKEKDIKKPAKKTTKKKSTKKSTKKKKMTKAKAIEKINKIPLTDGVPTTLMKDRKKELDPTKNRNIKKGDVIISSPDPEAIKEKKKKNKIISQLSKEEKLINNMNHEQMIESFQSFFPDPEGLEEIKKVAELLTKGGIGYNPKSRLSKEKQSDILQLKLIICKNIGLPAEYFNKVYLIHGGYELEVGAMNWLVATNAPTVEVTLRKHTEEEVVYSMRLSKDHRWFNFRYTAEMASNLVDGFTYNKHWIHDTSTMLRSRCLGKGYRTICPLALKGAQYVKGEISNDLPDFKDVN